VAVLTSARSWRGSSSVFAALGRGLAARGHGVVALVAHEPLVQGFRAQGLNAVALPIGHTRLTGARALRRAFQEFGSEIVFADKPRDLRLAALASLRRPLAIVYCPSTPRPPRDLLTRLAFRRVRLTVFLTAQLARQSLSEARFMRRAPYRVIPNGVDCEFFRPDPAAGWAFRRRYGLGDGPLLLSVGALAAEKRWDVLLDGVSRLTRPAPPLVVCGSGPLAPALRAQAQWRGLDARFMGWLEPSQLVGAFNAATCVVHAGPEACSLALTEALACGRPVLAADSGGTRELLDDAGALAPPLDAETLARLLQDLLEDPRRRAALSAAARRRAVEHFSLGRMVHAYVDLLESI
jgi:glycosyltransferase involved in cell wall biosynthesis